MDILLEWNASSDNVGVRGYELEVTSSSGVKVYKLSNVTSYLLRNLVDSENLRLDFEPLILQETIQRGQPRSILVH
jgi:hypothetical protein